MTSNPDVSASPTRSKSSDTSSSKSSQSNGTTSSTSIKSNGTWMYEHEGIKYLVFFPLEPSLHLDNVRNMPYKPGDTFMCAYPKSGTHWLLEIVSMVKKGSAKHSTEFNILDIIPTVACDSIAAHRVFGSHLRWNQLPEDARASGAKVVYCLRNPKDVAVSLYNFNRKMREVQYKGSWEEFLAEFMAGNVSYSSWFDHVTSWEQARDADRNNQIMFVYYEDVQKDARKEIQRLADFLEVDITKDLLDEIVNQTTFHSMSTHNVQYHPYPPEVLDPNHQTNLFRKGKVGDWKNWFTYEQKHAFDKVYAAKMKKSSLNFKYQLCTTSPLQPRFYRYDRD